LSLNSYFKTALFLFANQSLRLSFLALCIHVSPECKAILDQLGGYHLEERGAVEMKVSRSLMYFAGEICTGLQAKLLSFCSLWKFIGTNNDSFKREWS